jgi:hypothetical protein
MSISKPNERTAIPTSLFSVLLSISILTACCSGMAEDFSNFYSDAVLRNAQLVFTNDMESLFTTIRRHLSPEENQKLADVHLEFPLRDAHPLNFYSNAQEKRVILPVLSKVFLSDLALAYVWLVENHYNPQTVMDYAGMLGYYVRKSRSDLPLTKYFGGRFPLPLAALQIPQDAARSPAVADNRDQKVTDAMVFAFCHELGHVLYGHPSYSSIPAQQARANEAQADAFAVDILRRISRAPLGTAFCFLALAHFNGNQGEQFVDARTHPLTAARLQSLAQALDQNAAEFAKNETDREAWATNAKSLAGELKQVAAVLNDIIYLNGVQVVNLNSENMKERLAPRRTQTYVPSARPDESLPAGKFSGVYDCKIWSVLQGQEEGQVGGGPPLQMRVILRRKGDSVDGEYTWLATGGTGRLHGKIENDRLSFNWNEAPNLGFPPGQGTGVLDSEDGSTLTGDWGRNENKKDLGKWDATRVDR